MRTGIKKWPQLEYTTTLSHQLILTHLESQMLDIGCTLNPQQRKQQLKMSYTLHLNTSVVMDYVIQRLQAHLDLFEPVSMLALFAGVYVRGCDLHERVEVLCVGTDEV